MILARPGKMSFQHRGIGLLFLWSAFDIIDQRLHRLEAVYPVHISKKLDRFAIDKNNDVRFLDGIYRQSQVVKLEALHRAMLL